MKLTNNFSLQEFASKDGAPFPDEVVTKLKQLAKNLQVLRDELGAPISINSGYRSPSHNKMVGGATKSTHLYGQGADIVVKGYTPKQVFGTIDRLISEGRMIQGGLHAYASFTHYDIRGTKARW